MKEIPSLSCLDWDDTFLTVQYFQLRAQSQLTQRKSADFLLD